MTRFTALVAKVMPDIPERLRVNVLLGLTSYPLADAETVEAELKRFTFLSRRDFSEFFHVEWARRASR